VPVVGATEVTSPSRALVEASAHARLVVLGSRGHSRVVGALLGSVAFAVTSQAACPVIVVRDESSRRAVGPDHHVVAGTDGSPESMAALDFAADYAQAAAAPLEVVTCTGERHVEDVDERRLRTVAEQIADTAAARARAGHRNLDVTTRVENRPPEPTLVEASRDAGLVVVGTRGRGAFEGMLLGSVSHAVIHGAECAVAVVDDRSAVTRREADRPGP
jgi:nucleotide-binding universal stress UspA family protein